MFLANIVSIRPLNFAFSTGSVNINIPKGTLLLVDAITDRNLISGSEIEDQNININYPTEFDGLNFIVSPQSGDSLSMINHRNANSIPSTSSIVALINLTKTLEASVIMNGNYTVNGLANGIGTESAALMGTGKIIFDAQSGIIDFTQSGMLYLIIGGIFNTTIESQSSIRLTDYAEDSIYTLYWDAATSSLKAEINAIGSTDISKLALIKDGRIIPFVDTGIYYSKPYMDAPYFTEKFDQIDNIYVSSDSKINIVSDSETKIEFSEDTYVCYNRFTLQVKNKECYYEDRQGLHYILFDLDSCIISCNHHTDNNITLRSIVLGTMWIGDGHIEVSGNFEYTINGKAPYKLDLDKAESNIEELQNILMDDLIDNKIISTDEIYKINNEEVPIYTSSMLIKTTEGIKPAVMYNKNNDEMKPIVKFFDNELLIDDTMGDKISLLVYDKYNSKSYLRKDINIKKVDANHREGHSVRILCLGDELVNDFLYNLNSKLISLGLNPEMVGTMVNNQIYGEGRTGWSYSTFLGATGKLIGGDKIHPQTSNGESSVSLNPFVRIANADDKANNPNICYRANGDYLEKSYYTDNNKDGEFYIFDFAKYMEVQGIETPTIVIITVKPETIREFTEDIVGANMLYMKQLISGIREVLPSTKIAIVPQYGMCTMDDDMWNISSKIIEETIKYVNSLEDEKIKVLSSWLHMNREFGTNFVKNIKNNQLYEYDSDNKLSDIAKVELANSIVSYIMNN